jgi:hypothetical protein
MRLNRWSSQVEVPRIARVILSYLAGVVAGGTLAVLASHYAARDDVYVMLAVLLVVGAALSGGTGPAIAVAITAVIGDDVVLTGRLPPVDQWKDELVFGTIAVAVGLLARTRASHRAGRHSRGDFTRRAQPARGHQRVGPASAGEP